jgi:hypothetical protein
MNPSADRLRPHTPLLHAYCHLCQRWRLLAADDPGSNGFRDAVPAVARCPDCGEFGLVKVRMPATRPIAPTLLNVDDLPSEHWRTRA